MSFLTFIIFLTICQIPYFLQYSSWYTHDMKSIKVLIIPVLLCIFVGFILMTLRTQMKPAPTIAGWIQYTDPFGGNFTFDYPDVLPEFTQTTEKNPTSFRSSKKGVLEILVSGPIPETAKFTQDNWTSEESLPRAGTFREKHGITNNSMISLDGHEALLATFTRFDEKNPYLWRVYFYTKNGIYFIDARISGSSENIDYYQSVFSRILTTFKYSDSEKSTDE